MGQAFIASLTSTRGSKQKKKKKRREEGFD
jgi:hypothetical protein